MSSSAVVSPGFLFVKPTQEISSIRSKLCGKILKSASKFTASNDSGEFEFKIFPDEVKSVIKSESVRPIWIVPENQVSCHKFSIDDKVIPTKVLIYFDTIHSTQILLRDLLAQIPDVEDAQICITSNQQVCGRGRKEGRQWHSPSGCAMFSFNYHINNRAAFLNGGRSFERVGFVQHIACLSIIRALEFLFKPLNASSLLDDFKIKWPNDIYYKRSKIAGLIMHASHQAVTNSFTFILGIGINVSNREPTDCLNGILERDAGLDLSKDKLTIEQVIGRIITEFNDFLNLMCLHSDDAFNFVRKQYEQKWMHRNQIVDISTYGPVKIIGVNDSGYLIAQKVSDQQIIPLGPEMDEVQLDLPCMQ